MTKQELYSLLVLRRQLANNLKLLASLEANIAPKADSRDPTGDLAVEVADLKDCIEGLKDKISRSEAAAAAWIQTVEDARTRMVFRLQFIHGLAWKDVAALIGGRNAANSVKLICYRYLAAHQDPSQG